MAVIKTNSSDIDLLARLMRAEAEGEGELGMLKAGNVMVNRVRVRCSDFEDINDVERMVYQSPGGFEAVQKGYFYQRARERDKRRARRLVQGERFGIAEHALWFYRPDGDCPPEWFGQPNTGRYKLHCFFQPTYEECQEIFNTF
ncbi:cell wall hydrolase [Alteribacter lacisalsi]|uniref:Cell wall hydrolase n=1 Tax=Alteribacter lacisalsi TaxID=2045244 RepID=A0A2W0H3B5_9BACI|nr:cell wall hydrolase [Alteribacter lacisalsi]PYZ96304.1 cell wall hydrolase [Alteribacter lacisalsi]